MIAASLLALASVFAPTPSTPATIALPTLGYTQDTMRHLKGHPSLPARSAAKPRSSANAVCHPDPGKGRVCRHHVGKKDEARRDAIARTDLAANATASTAR